ncbi:MAG: response regulator [Gammaproteobacteria bacterium]|nr:response regulator [Gammaproteobacteria bacterium]
MNLATNACHAVRDKGRGKVIIEVAASEVDAEDARNRPQLPPGAYVALSVYDDGEGMNEATVARMFEPFFTTKGPSEGSGLGLSVVHGIVTQLGGDILVQSAPGAGTRIRVLLPACPDSTEMPSVPPGTRTPLPRGTETILFVDDEPSIASIGRDMLERLGYQVICAADGRAALLEFEQRLAKVDSIMVDLLVTDLTMPVMLGRELALQVRQLRPDVPIVLMSGARENGESEAWFDEFLAKPFSLESLARTVRSALDRRARRGVDTTSSQ